MKNLKMNEFIKKRIHFRNALNTYRNGKREQKSPKTELSNSKKRTECFSSMDGIHVKVPNGITNRRHRHNASYTKNLFGQI